MDNFTRKKLSSNGMSKLLSCLDNRDMSYPTKELTFISLAEQVYFQRNTVTSFSRYSSPSQAFQAECMPLLSMLSTQNLHELLCV